MPALSHAIPSRLILAAVIAGSLFAGGCAKHQDTRTTTVPTTASPTTQTSPAPVKSTASPAGNSAAAASLPDKTGIAACDDYLSSYLAYHRAAEIYAPDQLQSRYEAMRTSLLRDSQKPNIRPQLANRCNSLSSQLRQALHGKSCAENPAPASSSP